MVDIKISGRKVSVSDSLREHVEEKISDALKVFDIKPMTCDVVLRVDKNPSNPERKACEVTVFVRDNVVIIDRRQRMQQAKGGTVTQEDLAALIEPGPDETEDDQLVREKYVDLVPMTEEEALVQTDLIGHDFYVFTNATTGLVNVIYHRKNGGYGIIKPKIEEENEQ